MPVKKNYLYSQPPPNYPTFQRDKEPTILDVAARQLTDHELSIFQEGLYDYEKRHNLEAFVKCLDYSLTSTQKRQLIFPILNNVVRPSDRGKFSQLLIRYGLAVPATPEQKKVSSPSRRSPNSLSPPRSPQKQPELKRIKVKRDNNGEWGFDIRGGVEHGVGVFVSWVDPDSTADRAGLKLGDQILKANGVNFETISHYDAVEVIRSTSKLQMTLLPLGRLPMDYDMNPQMYRWTDARGKPCSPPPRRHLTIPRSPSGQLDPQIYQEPDVRKVKLSQLGEGYGVSIRGGVEHGLGIYVSYVEDGSVGAINGIKIGDQILEVNNMSFLSVTHEEAAKVLKSSHKLVMTLRSVGKLPHSKLSQYNQTPWQRTSPERRDYEDDSRGYRPKEQGRSMFAKGMGTQVMHKKQKVGATSSHHMMLELARSLLNGGELKTFSYYLNQYESERIGVDDLVTALLRLLDSDEKKGLLSEVRPVIAARDLDRFNELTVHAEIAARRRMQSGSTDSISGSSVSSGPPEDIIPGLSENFSLGTKGNKYGAYNVQDARPMDTEANLRGNILPRANLSTNNNNTGLSDESTLTPGRMEPLEPSIVKTKNTERPPKIATETAKPTTKSSRSTSTPQGTETADPQMMLESTLKERRKRVNPGSFINKKGGADMDGHEDTWDEQWEETTISTINASEHHHHSIQSQRLHGEDFTDGQSANNHGMTEDDIRRIQEQAKQEAENRARREYEEILRKEREELQRQQEVERKRWEEEERLRRAHELARMEEDEQARLAMEEKIRQEAQDSVKKQYEDMLKRESEERARLAAEIEARREAGERLARELQAKEEMEAQLKREQEEMQRLHLQEIAAREKEEQLIKEHTISQQAEKEQEMLQRAQEEQERLQREREEQERLQREREEQERLQKAQEEQRKREERDHQRTLEEEIRREEEERRRESEEQIRQKEEEEYQKKMEAMKQRQEAQERKQREEQEQLRRAQEQKQKELERKQKEEQRKAEELQRKIEEERKREEEKLKQKEQKEKERRDKAAEEERKWREEQDMKRKETASQKENDKRKIQEKLSSEMVVHREKVKFDDSPPVGAKNPKPRTVSEDRERAEELLNRRIEKSAKKDKPKIVTPIPVNEGGKRYKEFSGLFGDILTIEIKKTTQRLGIAIEGGMNTKLKILKIREVTAGCCAALTGTGLSVGQQILAVDDISLFGKKHKEAALAIKGAFDSDRPVMKLVVLEPEES
jgi:hypothetical protein